MSKTRKLLERGLAELRQDPTIALLVLANLFAVFENGRTARPVAAILILFWIQMLIIGVWTCIKLVVIGRWRALLSVPVFLLMYLSFVGMLGFVAGGLINGALGDTPLHAGFDLRSYFLWSGVAFLVAHGTSFFRNFVGKREYARISWENQVTLPIMRALPMWIAVTLAAMIGSVFGSIELAMLVIVPVKIVLDVTGHTLQHLILEQLPRRELEPEPT